MSIPLTVLALLSLAGCPNANDIVTGEADNSVDFTDYSTFEVLDPTTDEPIFAHTADSVAALLDALDSELVGVGLTASDETSDLVVVSYYQQETRLPYDGPWPSATRPMTSNC